MDIRICEFHPQHTPTINAAEVHDSCRVYLWAHQLELTKLHDMVSAYCQSAPGCDEVNNDDTSAKQPMSAKRQTEMLSLKIMCSKIFGANATIGHTAEGKPILEGIAGHDIHISVTHTSGYYALSIATVPHGIDIEHKGGKALRIKDKFISTDESLINLSQFRNTEDHATALWCAKEAAFKTFSSPTLTLLNEVKLVSSNDKHLVAHPEAQEGNKATLHFFQIDDCILAVCL